MGIDNIWESSFRFIYLSGLFTFLLAIIFLHKREKKKYLRFFAYFWFFSFCANTVDLLYYYYTHDIIILISSIFYLTEALFLLKAVHQYFNQELKQKWLKYFKAIIIMILAAAFIFKNQFFVLMPALTYLSFAFIKSSNLFFNHGFNEISTFTSVVSGLLGLNFLISPFIPQYFFSSGSSLFIKGLLGLLFGLSIFGSYYEKLQNKLKIREEQYQKLFDQSPAGMMLLDKYGQIIKVNKSITKYTGYSKEELEGQSVFKDLIPTKYKIRAQKNINEILAGEDLEYIMETADREGNEKYFLMKESKFKMPDYSNCILSMRIDYTEYRKQQQKIKYLSYHDNLTDLYNRIYMEEEMKRLDSDRQLPISIIMIDVNGLKLFNDTYGHQKGDELLKKTAEIIKDSTRKEDIVARWAGDEFVILLPKTNIKNTEKIINRIEDKCSETEEDEIIISLSIGAATKETKDQSLNEIFDKADEKMYKEKMSKSRGAKKELVENIIKKIEKNNPEEKEHRIRMQRLSTEFADYIDLQKDEKEKLTILAELHDLGKISVNNKILNKKGELKEEESIEYREHPEQGYKIAAASKEFAFIAKEILYHHEHWDGTGYPEGLKKEEIPFLSRIIMIINTYEHLSESLNNSKTMERIIEYIKKEAGKKLDPNLTNKFIKFIKEGSN